jgi:membrane protein
MKKKFSFKSIFPLFKKAFSGFSDDKVPKLSASLAYYTVFSIGPLLLLIVSLLGFFMGDEAGKNQIFTQLDQFIGADAAKQLQDMVRNASLSDGGTMAMIIGIVTLLIGATGVFGEIQDSINSIWGLKPKPKAGIMKLIKTRLLSFGIIGSLGFIMLVSLAITSIIESLGGRLKDAFPGLGVAVLYVINLVLTLGVTTLLFAVIFKVLPDAKIRWKDVWIGAFVTSLLFLVGKFGISLYVSKSNIGSTYGAAGSLVILLVWIYYSAMILYLGAEFTKAYILEHGAGIKPNHYAELVEQKTVPTGEGIKTAEPQQRPQERRQPQRHFIPQPIRHDAPIEPLRGERPPQPAVGFTPSEANHRTGTHLKGFPAVAVGVIAFVVNAVRSSKQG